MASLAELLRSGDGLPQSMLAGGAIALALLMLISVMTLGARQDKQRQRRIARVRQPERLAARGSISVKRATADSSIEVLDKLIKKVLPNPAKLRARLARTGLKISLGNYLIAGAATIIVVFAAVKLAFGFSSLFCILVGLTAGIGLPHFVVGSLGKRRLNKFNALFPDAIDLIVRGLRSGLPVTESMKVVAAEVAKPVGEEFQQVCDSIRFGMTMNEAMWAAAPRIDVPEFRYFAITLSIQQETGGNLAETLENLSNVLRRRRQMKLKIKAFSSEAKASAYIIGSLPFIMLGIIMMMNYDYAIQLFIDPRGLMMVAGALVCYLMGVGIMAKMIRFEI